MHKRTKLRKLIVYLWVFENILLRRYREYKGQELTEGRRKLYIEELYNFYTCSIIIKVMKSGIMRHVDTKCTCRVQKRAKILTKNLKKEYFGTTILILKK